MGKDNGGGGSAHQRAMRRHRQPPTVLEITPTTGKSVSSLGTLVWSWGVVAFLLSIAVTGGLGFMTSDHPFFADFFFLLALVLFVTKWATWEGTKEQTPRKKVFITASGLVIAVALCMIAIWGNHKLNSGGPLIRSSVQVTHVFLSPATAPPYVDVYYKNGGPISTDKEILTAKTTVRSILDVPVANDQSALAGIFLEATKEFSKTNPKDYNWRQSLGPQQESSDRYFLGAVPTSDLIAGNKAVFTIVLSEFSDSTGDYRKASCWFWVTPNNAAFYRPGVSMPENWWQCYPPNLPAWENEKVGIWRSLFAKPADWKREILSRR